MTSTLRSPQSRALCSRSTSYVLFQGNDISVLATLLGSGGGVDEILKKKEKEKGSMNAMTRLWTFQFGLLIIFLSCLEVFGEETASMVVFDLNTNDSSSLPGVITMSFGSPPQDIDLLVSFYTGEASAYIPAGALCSTSSTSSTAGTDWNKILEPSEGDFVQSSNGSGSLAGVQLVEWRASTDTNSKKVNISLRKGRGDAAVNVTVIESGYI